MYCILRQAREEEFLGHVLLHAPADCSPVSTAIHLLHAEIGLMYIGFDQARTAPRFKSNILYQAVSRVEYCCAEQNGI